MPATPGPGAAAAGPATTLPGLSGAQAAGHLRPRAWLAPWLLVVPVAVAHIALAALWPEDHFGLGDGAGPMVRIDVAYVRELAPTQPAPLALTSPAARLPRAPPQAASSATAAAAAAAAASAARVAAAELPAPTPALRDTAPDAPDARAPQAASAVATGEPAEAPAAQATPAVATTPTAPAAEPLDSTEAATPLAAAAPALATSAATPSPTAFEWPPSTRLSYILTGNYRGPVDGQARVEWRLAGERYQVALDVSIGPPFAPLLTRQIQSDGRVTAAGLEPRRYDEETRIVLRAPRRLSIVFEDEQVLLPSGRQLPRPPGVQDSASQFVQMTWLFTTQPERLRTGTLLALPLALPRHVEVWTYEVLGSERLETPVGAVDAVHVRPRRPPRPQGAGSGGDLVAEFWVAPTLQHLPVRILIRQDEETYVDLMLQRLPQQAQTPQR